MKRYSKLALLLTLCLALLLPGLAGAESSAAQEVEVSVLPSLEEYVSSQDPMTINWEALFQKIDAENADNLIVQSKSYGKDKYVPLEGNVLEGKQLLYIEDVNKHHPLWAGVYMGDGQAPQCILQPKTESTELPPAKDNNYIIDLTGVTDALVKHPSDDVKAAGDMTMVVYHDGKLLHGEPFNTGSDFKHSPTRYAFKVTTETDLYIEAQNNSGSLYAVLWAGKLTPPEEGSLTTLTFSAYDEPADIIWDLDNNKKLTYNGDNQPFEVGFPENLPKNLQNPLKYYVETLASKDDEPQEPEADKFEEAKVEAERTPCKNVGYYRVWVKLEGVKQTDVTINLYGPETLPSLPDEPGLGLQLNEEGAESEAVSGETNDFMTDDEANSGNGNSTEEVDQVVIAHYDMVIFPVPVTVVLGATSSVTTPQDYTGGEITMDMVFEIKDITSDNDESVNLFKTTLFGTNAGTLGYDALTELLEQRPESKQLTKVDVGTYTLEEEEKSTIEDAWKKCIEDKLEEEAKNFDINVHLDEVPSLEITKREVEVTLVAEDGKTKDIYHEGASLSFKLETSDDKFFPGDFNLENNELNGAGVLHPIDVKVTFDKPENDNNYKIKVTGEDVLVMFPQSIDEADTHWDDVTDNLELYEEWETSEQLPAYYNSMEISLAKDEFTYDGTSKADEIKPKILSGEEIDFAPLTFEKFAADNTTWETAESVIEPGKYRAIIKAADTQNYQGEIKRDFTIDKKEISGLSLGFADAEALSDGSFTWVYDGRTAREHGLTAEPSTQYFSYYTDVDCKQPVAEGVPMNAGTYYVKASWVETDTTKPAELEVPVAFTIQPLHVKITVQDEKIEKIEVDTGKDTANDDEAKKLFTTETEFDEGDDLPEAEFKNKNWLADYHGNFDVEVEWVKSYEFVYDKDTDGDGVVDWVYDGEAAGSEKHSIHINPKPDSIFWFSYKEDGESDKGGGEAPSNVGSYSYRVFWPDDKPSDYVEFRIKAMPVTLSIEPKASSIDFGDELPGYDMKVETPVDISDELRAEIESEWTVTNNYDGGVGNYSYSIDANVPGKSGNFELEKSDPGNFNVNPRELSIEDFAISVTNDKGRAQEVESEAFSGEELQSYAGDFEVAVTAGDVTLAQGEDFELYEPVETDANLNQIIVRGKGNYEGDILLKMRVSTMQKLLEKDGGLPWLILAVVLLLGAGGCILAAVRLSGRIKRDSLKLLDKVSRQSSRTIRRGR